MLFEPPEMRPGWIAYVGLFAFPRGDEMVARGAAARRVLGVSRSIAAGGRDVLIVSGEGDNACETVDRVSNNVLHISVNERERKDIWGPLRYAGVGRVTACYLRSARVPPAAVIVYSGYTPYLLNLLVWCRSNGIPLIFDAVEWYAPRRRLGYLVSPYHWNIEFAMRFLLPRLSGVITISAFLTDYYRANFVRTCRIPPSLDVRSEKARLQTAGDRMFKLSYAGSVLHDGLGEIVQAVLTLHLKGRPVQLVIAGPSREELDEIPALAQYKGRELPDCILAQGRVTHAEAMNQARNADYVVFLRARNRVTTAGFPTKFVEAMSVGTPVITTLTSDLGTVLFDGSNGFVCKLPNAESLSAVLDSAFDLSPKALVAMRASARATAEAEFDFRVFTEVLSQFLKDCIGQPWDRNR